MKKQCEYCQTLFEAMRNSKRYCSPSCKQLAYLQRNGFGRGKEEMANVVAVNDKNPMTAPMEHQYVWPKLFVHIDDYLLYTPDRSIFSGHEWNQEQQQIVQWVNIRLKCILIQLKRLTYKSLVVPETFRILYEALTDLINSANFMRLPPDYPYTTYIKNLADYIGTLINGLRNRGARFRIEIHAKAQILAMIYAMGDHVSVVKFSELSFC